MSRSCTRRLWREQREQVLHTAEQLERALAAQLRPLRGELRVGEAAEEAYADLVRLYDPRWGGFVGAPKFPTAPWLFFLLRYAARQGGDGRARVMLEETLRAMRLGGIWDHLGHGFHRYATDAGWLVSHFEKMLSDQALLALAYTEAYRLWGDTRYPVPGPGGANTCSILSKPPPKWLTGGGKWVKVARSGEPGV